MNNEYRHYLRCFAVTALTAILLVAALNLLVDPYDRFGLNRLGVYVSAEREFKNTEFERFAPEAVLLGDSRAAMIDVDGLKGLRFFNAGFGSAEVEEIDDFIVRHVKDQKLVVIGLGLSGFGPLPHPVENPFQPLTVKRALEYILSLQNIKYSERTILKHLRHEPVDILPNGTYARPAWVKEADEGDAATTRSKVLEFRNRLMSYKFDPARLAALREIRDTLVKRGIRLLVYIPPTNADVWKALEGTAAREELNRTRREIIGIFPQTVDLTESEYSAPEGFFRADAVHFRSGVGQRFLNERVLNGGPETAR
jgi:hypothetical protein